MNEIKVLIYRRNGFISNAIKWQTRSIYSHAAIVINGVLIEALEFKGVIRRDVKESDFKGADVFNLPSLSFVQREELKEFLREQIGKKYDYRMISRFITRKGETKSSKNKWFCSELVFAAFLEAGIELLKLTKPFEVSPGLLSKSPILTLERKK